MADFDDWEDMMEVSAEEISQKLQNKPTNKYDDEEQQEEVPVVVPVVPIKRNKALKDKLKIKEDKPVKKDDWDEVLDMQEPLPYNPDEYVPQKQVPVAPTEVKPKEDEKTKGKRKVFDLFVPSDMGVNKMKKSLNYKNGDYEQALYKHFVSYYKKIKELNEGFDFKDVNFKNLPLPFSYEQLTEHELKKAWMNIANKEGRMTLYEKVLNVAFEDDIRRDFILTDKRNESVSRKSDTANDFKGIEKGGDKSAWYMMVGNGK